MRPHRSLGFLFEQTLMVCDDAVCSCAYLTLLSLLLLPLIFGLFYLYCRCVNDCFVILFLSLRFMSEWSNHLKATWPAAMDKMPENSAAAITRPNAQQQKDAFTKFGNGMLDVSQTIKALKHLFDGMGVTKTTQQIQSQVYVLMDQVSEDGDELSLGEFVQLVDLAIP